MSDSRVHVQVLEMHLFVADADAQVRILADLVHEGVNGIAVAPVNAESVISVIGQARIKSIPVITFDSDSPRSDTR